MLFVLIKPLTLCVLMLSRAASESRCAQLLQCLVFSVVPVVAGNQDRQAFFVVCCFFLMAACIDVLNPASFRLTINGATDS